MERMEHVVKSATGTLARVLCVAWAVLLLSALMGCGAGKSKSGSGMTDQQQTEKMMQKMQEEAKAQGKAPAGGPAARK